jgi:glycerophosphoryl diester phosphodiesterase
MRRKIGRFLIGLFLVLLTVYTALALLSRPVANHPFFANQSGPLVIAHQGGDGLWPSNTMFAFQQAADLGVDVLEMDIHGTADGTLVVMHDATVDRATDGSGELRQMTLVEIQMLDAGYEWPYEETADHPFRGQGITVPTLEEVLMAFPDMPMNIEIKQVEPPIVAPFCQLLRQYNRTDKTLVASFSAEVLQDFRQECPEVATSAAEDEVRPFFILNTLFLGAVYQAPAEAFQVPEYSGNLHVVTRRFVDNAHAHNMDVHVWTVDEEEDMRRLLGLGVDGIITDRPDRLMQLLGR